MEESHTPELKQVVLVTGLSGAGKSTALKFLEDMGFAWVDNLPFGLLPTYLDHWAREEGGGRGVAVGIHVRDERCLDHIQGLCDALKRRAQRVDVLFLEAGFDILVTRYRESRRRHPMADDLTVGEAIAREAANLEPVRAIANTIIDTSGLPVPQLKSRLMQLYGDVEAADLTIFIRSFGFKYGTNTDADMVLDARFLANPYYLPELRPLTGRDEAIRRYLEEDTEAVGFLDRLLDLFDYLIPRYREEKKRYFTVDIGCTGGRHRSVYMVERLAERLAERGYRVHTRHRDLEREGARGGAREGGTC